MINIIDVIKAIFSMSLFANANVYLWVNMTRNDRKTKSLNRTVQEKKTKQIARQKHEPVDSLRILWAPLELLFSIIFFLSTSWILCIFVSPAHLRRRFDCSTHRSVTSTLAKINQAQIKATWCLYGTLCISKVVQLRFIQLRRFSTRKTNKKKIKTNKNPNEAHAR